MKALCMTHVAFEGPARIAEWTRDRGHHLDVVRADSLPAPISLDGYEALIVMGGPMSANDEFPWLVSELKVIESALMRQVPMMGVCLGAQLLAKVLGARVFTGSKEIGWWPVQAVPHASTGAGLSLPNTFVPFHWHGETFDLPQGAHRLATSAAVDNQAFLYAGRALGLQFHVEASEHSVGALINEASQDITEGPWIQSAAAMLAECTSRCGPLQAACYSLLDRFFEPAASATAG